MGKISVARLGRAKSETEALLVWKQDLIRRGVTDLSEAVYSAGIEPITGDVIVVWDEERLMAFSFLSTDTDGQGRWIWKAMSGDGGLVADEPFPIVGSEWGSTLENLTFVYVRPGFYKDVS